MQNIGAQGQEGHEEGGAVQMSAANGSMELGTVNRRIMDTNKSDLVSHGQEDS